MSELPPGVRRAHEHARAAGFELSCEPAVGALLATLAATVPVNGRILELGTGAGVGLAWVVHGLGGRDDVAVTTVDIHAEVQALAKAADWPAYVQFELGDGTELLPQLGRFDLVFADAPGGKFDGLELTVAALKPGGVLLVDDLDVTRQTLLEIRSSLQEVREKLLAAPELRAVELSAFSSGVMVCVRR